MIDEWFLVCGVIGYRPVLILLCLSYSISLSHLLKTELIVIKKPSGICMDIYLFSPH